jgi:hypothetical protein
MVLTIALSYKLGNMCAYMKPKHVDSTDKTSVMLSVKEGGLGVGTK